MNLNYKESEKEILDFLNQNPFFVLATSENNRVTARTISCVNYGLTILFQTDKEMDKYRQMKNNPNVALSIKNIQIEGNTVFKGHPLNEENGLFIKLLKEKHLNAFQMYSHLENSVVVEVHLKKVTFWKYIDGKSYRDYIDLGKKDAIRQLYV